MKKIFIALVLSFYTLFGFSFDQNGILKPEDAFKAFATKEGDKIHTVLKLAPQIYIYDKELKYLIIKPKKIDLDNFIQRPKPVKFHDFIVHRNNDVIVDIPISLIKKKIDSDKFTLQIKYQGCSEKGICYQPLKKSFDFDLTNSSKNSVKSVWKSSTNTTNKIEAKQKHKNSDTKDRSQSEEDKIVDTLKHGSLTTILTLFFGFGLLLSLTPCIFPMIPILSSIIVSQSKNGEKMSISKGLFLSLVYVLSMSIAYTLAGILAGLFGANIQTAMQNPWVIIVFALIFVALAFSMFGYYEIQLPRALQNRINKSSDKAQGKGSILGVAIMGFLSALIVGPCVAPALAGALVYIGQTGDAILGGAALFVMSLGMGVPLLIVGAGAGKFMPRPGGWMTLVSQIFGVIMLAVAIWMISRIIPASVTLFLWSLLLIGSGVYAGAFENFPPNIKGAKKLIKVFAIVISLIGAIMLVGSFSGATNPLNPLEKFTSNRNLSSIDTMKKENFKVVKSIKELESEIKNSKKNILIDFSAKWCASCKELEENTFKNPKVIKLMNNFKLLRVDVTENSNMDKKLLKKYNLFGPPAIIFYNKSGHELKNRKIIGYKPPDVFYKNLQSVLENN